MWKVKRDSNMKTKGETKGLGRTGGETAWKNLRIIYSSILT